MEQKFGINSLNLQVLREFCEREGEEIDFDRSGNWDKVDCQYTAVPASIIPAPIASYVKVNFPQMPITKIDKKIYGYSVELSDEFELKFTSNGMLLFMDD